jgi:hypothetical protein
LPPTEKTSTGGDAPDKGAGLVAGGDKPAEAGKTSTGGDAPDKGTDAIAHGDKPAEAEKTSTGGDAPDKGAGLIAGGEKPAEAEGKSTVADASDKSTGLHTPSDPQLPDRPPQPLTSSSDGAAPLAKETPKPSQSAVEQSSPEKKLVRRLPPIEQEVSSASNVGLDALPDGDIPIYPMTQLK